jgi:hypothetical protein
LASRLAEQPDQAAGFDDRCPQEFPRPKNLGDFPNWDQSPTKSPNGEIGHQNFENGAVIRFHPLSREARTCSCAPVLPPSGRFSSQFHPFFLLLSFCGASSSPYRYFSLNSIKKREENAI